MILLLAALLAVPAVCSLPRDHGKLERSRQSVRDFRRSNPCPATHRTTGACRNFVVDHVVPLCAGGEDKPENMVWQRLAESREKDKAEVELCTWIERACRRARGGD